jgi:hypothetical protein
MGLKHQFTLDEPFNLTHYPPHTDADQGGFAIALSKNPLFHYLKPTFTVQMD